MKLWGALLVLFALINLASAKRLSAAERAEAIKTNEARKATMVTAAESRLAAARERADKAVAALKAAPTDLKKWREKRAAQVDLERKEDDLAVAKALRVEPVHEDKLLSSIPSKDPVRCGDWVAVRDADNNNGMWWTGYRRKTISERREGTADLKDNNVWEIKCSGRKKSGEQIAFGDPIALQNVYEKRWIFDFKDDNEFYADRGTEDLRMRPGWASVSDSDGTDQLFVLTDPTNLNNRDKLTNGLKMVFRTGGKRDLVIEPDYKDEGNLVLNDAGTRITEQTNSMETRGALVQVFLARPRSYDPQPFTRRQTQLMQSACWSGLSSGMFWAKKGGMSATMIMVHYMPGVSLHRNCHMGINRWWHACGIVKPFGLDEDCNKDSDLLSDHMAGEVKDKRGTGFSKNLAISFMTPREWKDKGMSYPHCNERRAAVCCSYLCRQW